MVNLKKYLGDFFELCASNGTIIGAEIGRGGSGWVYEGTLSKPFPGDFSGSTQCAVKLIEYNQKNKAYVDREINTQLGLDHPNVVRVFTSYVTKKRTKKKKFIKSYLCFFLFLV